MAVERTCEQCGKDFTTQPYKIKAGGGKYCSNGCKFIAGRTQVERTCEQCGKVFTTYPFRIRKGFGKYCSMNCHDVARQRQVDRICETCGKTFQAFPSSIKRWGGKYCSVDCYSTARQNKTACIQCVCKQCGKTFQKKPSVIKCGGGKYCSQSCRTLSQGGEGNSQWRGGQSSYRGPNWSQQRKLAYNRDRGICQHCGKKPRKGQRRFNVHHVKPYREFNGDYLVANQLTNLITLCYQCHQPAEFGKIAVQPYLL